MSVQIIELNGVPALAVLPIDEWETLLERLETLQDIADAKAAASEETFPAAFVDRLLAGEAPLKVWREYRGLTLQALAEASGTTRQMLSMAENGKANPSADLLARLARALDCDMDDLHGETAQRCTTSGSSLSL
ncbi:helix-turn-helix domain-containing protein [Thiocapsa rosea]|uniref:DNA-binding XRE family transcriptional regulator n=1 Tax=Thiocapsa rosea TaxID=69360 RepID=A0A495VBM4_9GAMM|nr:helix-turn-helix transcriptional regulator [Thiocapsa rosea]RKT46786.1 DNA-binding XRE family transcriptional regulator [Thiocapsa rosea]